MHTSPRLIRNFIFRWISILAALSMILPASALASEGEPGLNAVGTPVLATPTNDEIVHSSASSPLAIPEFTWSAVPDAVNYEIQFSQSIDFSVAPFSRQTPLTQYIPSDGNPFVDGNWYWHVRAIGPEGPGSWQITPFHFVKEWASAGNAPQLELPLNLAQIDFYDAPAFSWSAVTGATSYQLQIDPNQNGFNPAPNVYSTVKTTLQPEIKLPNGTYYWRVVPLDPYNRLGRPSAVFAFTMSYGTGPNNIEVPTHIGPINGSHPKLTPSFRWYAVLGAQYYRLQYSTDPTFPVNNRTEITTQNTSYTPQETLPNDVNYYWRVQAVSGSNESAFSQSWMFKKEWNIQTILLTPTATYGFVRFPFFSWTPVPAAAYYRIEVAYDQGFVNKFIDETTNNTFFHPTTYFGGCPGTPASCWRYWRVTPYDGSDKPGVPSTGSFQSFQENSTPDLVYPLYYYDPSVALGLGRPDMNPAVDRSIGIPIFIWNRLTKPYPYGGTYSETYRIEVSDEAYPWAVLWDFDTENTSAVPTLDDNFTPTIGEDYYWRVMGLDENGEPTNQWSQVWRTNFTSTLGLTETLATDPPLLLRPAQAAEFVESTPLMEWFPVQGADYYTVEISTDPEFDPGYTLLVETVPYPAYASPYSLAQRMLDRLDYGSFYWRVSATVSGVTGPWSEIRRFQVASQSEWALSRTLNQPENKLQIAQDPVGDTTIDTYDLSDLYMVQDNDYWYIGFHYAGTLPAEYVIYIDLDHKDGSGGDHDAMVYTQVSTIPAHRPEYAVYIPKGDGAVFNPASVLIFPWNFVTNDWGTPLTLNALYNDTTNHYLELKFSNESIGHFANTGSYALAMFSISTSGGAIQDSIPSTPLADGNQLSRFTSVSEHMNLVSPPNNTQGDPATYPYVMPTFFDYPTGRFYTDTFSTAPWAGVNIEIHKDPDYSNKIGEVYIRSTGAYYCDNWHTWYYDLQGDNTYYWRARPRYLVGGTEYFGSWTQGSYVHDPIDTRWSFVRKGFVPTNLQISVDFATPTFSWDIVEGTQRYEIQVAYDSDFTEMVFAQQTTQNSYTHPYALRNAHYYWRVRAVRRPDILNDFSEKMEFILELPVPENLTPDNPPVVPQEFPTLCWDKLILSSPSDGYPVIAAWKYRLQVSKNPLIPPNELIYNIDTEQNCWSSMWGVDDGIYYWHVAMMDGSTNLSDFSPVAQFTKQYPKVDLLAPAPGGVFDTTPVFTWALESQIPGEEPPAVRLYHIEVATDENFVNLYDGGDTPNTTWIPTKMYEIGREYWWRVAYFDRDGHWGPYNNATIYLGDAFKTYVPIIMKSP